MPTASRSGNGGRYSNFQLARKYCRYYLTAANGKGHGIHSPFVYDFVRNVLNDRRDYPEYTSIESLRGRLVNDDTLLSIEDMGAGSVAGTLGQRSIGDVARHAAKPRKLGQLLFRIARYYRPGTVLELGTSLGLSTAYLAAGVAAVSAGFVTRVAGDLTADGSVISSTGTGSVMPPSVADLATEQAGCVFTIEGAPAVAAAATKNFQSLGLQHIHPIIGNFDEVLEPALERIGSVDLAFIDGNHRLEPTLRYFNQLIGRLSSSSVLIFDDIHWSREMEEAWELIKQDSRVCLTIDLFFIGLVFFRDSFKVKQDFIIRF